MNIQSDKVLDELLVLQAQNGDKKSLAILVTRWHKKLVKYAYRYTNEMEVAKDLVQDSWQAIIKSVYNLQDPAKFRVWAFRIVHNKTVSWIRDKQKEIISNEEYKQNKALIEEEKPDFGPIREALNMLSGDHKTILTLFYFNNYSVQEIAEIMQLSTGTIKSRLFYARQKTKEYYQTLNI